MTYRDDDLASARAREQLEGDLEASLRRDHLKRRRMVATIYGAICVSGSLFWLWVFWWQLRPEPGAVITMHTEMFGSSTLGMLWSFGVPIAIFSGAVRFAYVAIRCTRELDQLRRA
jgi:hypothetical protein